MLYIFLALFWAVLVRSGCYEPNVAHPLPDYDVDDPELTKAFSHIEHAISAALQKHRSDSTSFSLEITSSKEPLWSKHHTASRRNASRPDVPEVNGDALYRIASISKTFTVLGILEQHKAGNLSLDDPIDKYIEELRGEQEGSIPWKDITLRSLASQLSGIPRDFAQSDLINRPTNPVHMGLPPVEAVGRDGLLECDEYGDKYEPPCTGVDLLKTVKLFEPLFAPNQKSTYSNIAFELLGLALSRVGGQSYEEYIENAIMKPLDMTKSTLAKPPDSAGVIPLKPHYWDVDAGIQNPTGGIYSSSTDLSKYLRYILSRHNGITSSLDWIHPVSPAEGLTSFYGMPWEIFRTDKMLVGSKRTVQFVTKSGGLPGYSSIIILLPDYDLGITILLAGPPSVFRTLQEASTLHLVRAAEAISIRQLQQRYAGAYVSDDPSLNSSLTLAADERGLIVNELISNGTDVLHSSRLPGALGAPGDQEWLAQLIPTLLYRNETAQEGEKWRMVVTRVRDDKDRGIWDDHCVTNIDTVSYAAAPVNEFVFWKGDEERFDRVGLSGFRLELVRKREGKGAGDTTDEEILEL